MIDMNDDDHFFKDMNPESPGTITKNYHKKTGVSQPGGSGHQINNNNNNTRSPNNNIIVTPNALQCKHVKQTLHIMYS